MKAVSALFALALMGCATTSPADVGPTAALGQVAYSNGLRFKPLTVVEDSRCPINAACVWAGRLIVRTEVNGSGWAQVRDLELGVPQAVAEFRVALIAAEPQKLAAGAMKKSRAYRFTFTASGR